MSRVPLPVAAGAAVVLALGAALGCGSDESETRRGSATSPATSSTEGAGAETGTATTSDRADRQPPAKPPTGPAGLSASQLAGQQVAFAWAGPDPPPGLERRIRQGRAGAVILFARNVDPVASVRARIRRLQDLPRPNDLRAPLLVLVDQEGGPVRRVPGGPVQSAATVGRSGGTSQARAAGRTAAGALRSVGANVDLAPVADVARAGSAMQREGRAFGGNRSVVSRQAGAFVAGVRSRGVATAAKHFPGFGAAPVNTDVQAQRIGLSRDELRSVDMGAFRGPLREGTEMVMLSTAVYPAFDDRPAALSRRIIETELRERLGFDGVTVTDALDTPALAAFGGPSRAAVRAASAGSDLLVLANTYEAGARAAEALARRLRASQGARRRSQKAVGRILALREGLDEQ
ncbi:MAG: glycoside hydrolase family 3 N-terminal domain-containing protein [Solirubrobacterales bacterium]